MFCDTHALSNYTGIITLLTETLKLVHHHHYRTCSRAPGKYHCVYSVLLCAHKTEKKAQNCRKLLVLRASRLRSASALILCGFSRRGSDAGALVCDLGRPTQSKYCAVWSLCADSCSQQATFYTHFTNVCSASSKMMPVTPAAAM